MGLKREIRRPLVGTYLGEIITNRTLCFRCYGEGADTEEDNQDCQECKGIGFIEEPKHLEMALLGLNLEVSDVSNVLWVSYPIKGIKGYKNRYEGLRAFAGLTAEGDAYCFIVDMRGLNTGESVANRLAEILQDIAYDFFSNCAYSITEVKWLYRNSDAGLDRLYFDKDTKSCSYSNLVEKWDGSDFSKVWEYVFIDNRLQLMIESSVNLADEHPY